jgi:phosphoglycolate phosphatase-like HAD superfamily hydrolase
MTAARSVAIDLDRALADTRALWDDWLDAASTVLGFDVASLPEDRGVAAEALDARVGNWRALLERFCEERVAVYVRRDPAVSDALRSLSSSGREIWIFTDAPEPLARLVLAQIGADRRVSRLETGAGALERLLEGATPKPVVVSSRDELLSAAQT